MVNTQPDRASLVLLDGSGNVCPENKCLKECSQDPYEMTLDYKDHVVL